LRLRTILSLLMLLLGGLGTLSAQTSQLPPLAAVSDQQLTFYNINGGAQTIARQGDLPFDNLRWRPDGEYLAFLAYGADFVPRLQVVGRGGGEPITLAENAFITPPSFDGNRVIYGLAPPADAQPEQVGGFPTYTVTLYAQEPRADAPREEIGNIRFGLGCGGGSPFPMDAVYNIETGFGGSDLVFAVTPLGIVHSTNCAGRGLALLNPDNGDITDLGGDLSRAAVSPDGRRVVAIASGSVVIVNLETGGRQTISTAQPPDQVAWDGNNAIFYSARLLQDGPLPLSEEEQRIFGERMGMADVSIPQYSVHVGRVSLSGGETDLYNGPGWAVGRMFASGGNLYFSVIPNGEGWVEAVTTGEIDTTTQAGLRGERATVPVTLLRVSINGGEASEIATGIAQATLHPSA